MPKKIDLTGQRFGRLVAISRAPSIKGRSAYTCCCDCGTVKIIPAAYLRHGGTSSCGCLRRETSAKTGKTRRSSSSRRNNPLYHRYHTMRQRCQNPKNPSFKNYGGRGITICDAWSDFDTFLSDMGEPPTKDHTVDRIDNDGPYSPQNCRWALPSEQLRNQRRSIHITCHGKTLHAKDWAARLGISYQSITKAYRQGGIQAATDIVCSAFPPRFSPPLNPK